MVKTHAPLVLIALLVVLLAACSASAPVQRWRGQTQDATGTYALTLDLQRTGSSVQGSYAVGSSTGTLAGRLEGRSLTATLTPGSGCEYSFSGTLSETTLTGEYLPTSCPSGRPGSWTLSRE